MTQLAIIMRDGPDGTVLVLAGDVDLCSSPQLCEVIDRALAAGPRCLTIDLDDLRFCDCSGLRALIRGRKHADQRHVDYRVTNPHGQVAMVLDVSGVLKFLNGPVEPDSATWADRSEV